MARRYYNLDPATLGPALELQEGGLVLACNADGSNALRNARVALGVSASRWYWEVIAYGEEEIEDKIVVGVVLATTLANTSPGVASGTHGYYPGTGEIWSDGALVATVAPAALRQVLGFALDLVASTPTLQLRINRLPVYTWELDPASTWFAAASIGCDSAYGLKLFFNSGRRAFEDPVPANFKPGIFINPQSGSAVRVASEDVVFGAEGSPPRARFAKAIKRAEEFYIERGISFWPDGRSNNTSYSTAELVLDNARGTYDALRRDPPRDARVTMVLQELDVLNQPVGDPIPLPPTVVDSIAEGGVGELVVRLRDPQSALQRPLQRKAFLPYVAEGAANRPFPIALGACRNVAPVLYDDTSRLYAIHDAALTQVAIVRDKGDPFDPLASPPDYTLTPDLRGIALQSDPDGKLTADVSSQGATQISPPPDADALEGEGDMAVDDGDGMPVGWWARPTGYDGLAVARAPDDGGRLECRIDVISSGTITGWDVRYQDPQTSRRFVTLVKGVRYRLSASIPYSRWPASPPLNFFYLVLVPWRQDTDMAGMQVLWSATGGIAAQQVTVDFRAESDGMLALWANVAYDAVFAPPALPWYVQFDDITCEALTALPDDVLGGYGQMLAGLARWTDDGSVGSGAFGQVDYVATVTTTGRMELSVGAGAGDGARARYDDGGGDPTLLADQHYRVALWSQGTSTNGRLDLINKTAGGDVVVATLSGTGAKEVTFVATGDGDLVLKGYTADALAGSFFVGGLRVWDVTAQDAQGAASETPLEGISLEQYFVECRETRGGDDAASWSHADAAAIDAAMPHPFGVAFGEAVTIDAALRLPLDGYCGALTTDNDGVQRIPLQRTPEDAGDEEVALQIDRTNCDSMPIASVDEAPGLTTNAGARRNWSVYGPSDFVDDFDPATGIDAATRERFKRASQYLVSAAVALHPMYQFAIDAGPIHLLFDSPADALARLTEVCSRYTVARMNWSIPPVRFEGAPPPVWPGAIVRVTWRRDSPADPWDAAGELANGKKLQAKVVRLYPLGQYLTIPKAWG